jgi:hypothetical protein
MVMRGSPVASNGRRWSEMDFVQHYAIVIIDENVDLNSVFCFKN